jgi:hypothetical protein
VYGRRADGCRFELDLNGNGAFDNGDISFLFNATGKGAGGRPVAGDWNGVGEDHVAVFNGTTWIVDLDPDSYLLGAPNAGNIDTIATAARGRPIAADFNGDGDDDVGLYQNNEFRLDFGSDDNFQVDFAITFGFNTTRQLPVAADWDADGDGNIGLFVQDRNGQIPREAAEWYLDLGRPYRGPLALELAALFPPPPGMNVATDGDPGDGLFQPPPTGGLGGFPPPGGGPAFPDLPLVFQDIFYQFGDELAEPIAGNFDPPIGIDPGVTPIDRPLERLDDPATRSDKATPLVIWERGGDTFETASINNPRDKDVFQFTPTDSGRVTIDAKKAGSLLDTNLNVYSSTGRAIARNNDFGGTTDSHVELDVVAGNTYFIEISAKRRTTGSYELAVDYLLVSDVPAGSGGGSTITNITMNTEGARSGGRIDRAGETDIYTFTPVVSGNLQIRTAAATKRLDTTLELFDSAGNLITRNNNADGSTRNSQVIVDVVAGEVYTIRIGSIGSKTGDYALELDHLLEDGL